MLRYAKYVLPFILKAPKQSPVKNLAGRFIFALLLLVGTTFFCVAALIWLSEQYGADIAFLAMGGILLLIAGVMALMSATKKKRDDKTKLPANVEHDPLAKFMPESVKQNPVVEKLLVQIAETPIAATVSAVSIGMLISRELLED